MKLSPSQDSLSVDLSNRRDGIPERILPEELETTVGREHLARYLFAALWMPGRRVADLCCGMGYGANLLAAAGASRVYGVDICAPVIEEAKQRYSREGVEFFTADVLKPLPIPKVDIAVCFEGIEHLPDPNLFLFNLRSILSEGGVAIISTPNGSEFASGYSGNPHHIREFSVVEFEDQLSRFFTNINIYFQWSYRDPYNFQWSLLNILRALTPIKLKHTIRSVINKRKAGESGGSHETRDADPLIYHPFPISYLALPGLRFGLPQTIVAVCKQ